MKLVFFHMFRNFRARQSKAKQVQSKATQRQAKQRNAKQRKGEDSGRWMGTKANSLSQVRIPNGWHHIWGIYI